MPQPEPWPLPILLDDFFAQHKTREDVKLGANRKYKSANTGSGVNNFAPTGETDVNTNATFIHQSNNNIIRHNEVKAFAVESPAFIPTTPKRQVASNTFTGVASGTIMPNNAIYLDVDNPILELPQIKERVSNGEFKNYDNLVIKYHDNEFVLTIKDIKA